MNYNFQINTDYYQFLKDMALTYKGVVIGVGIDPLEFYNNGRNIVQERILTIPDEDRAQHFGCLGTTGCGKTSIARCMVAQDILLGRDVIVINAKPDPDLFSTIIESAYVTDRMEEILFVSPVHPEESIQLNLLQYFVVPDELIDHIVSGVRAKDEYYRNVAEEATRAIVGGLLVISKSKQDNEIVLNPFEIKKWCSYDGFKELQKTLNYLTSHPDPEVRKGADEVLLIVNQIMGAPPDFFAKVSSSLRVTLSALSSFSTGKVVGRATQNEVIRRLENGEPLILYCDTGSLLARRTANTVARVILSMIQACMGRLLDKGKSFARPLCVYIDEGHNTLYYGIQELFNKGRAAKLWLSFFTQSYSQMVQEIGQELTSSIVDNISTWLYMRLNKEDSPEIISESSPEIRRKYALHDFPNGIYVPIIRESSGRLIPPEKIMSLPDRHFYLKKKGKFYRGCSIYVKPPEVLVDIDYSKVRDDIANIEKEFEFVGIEI